MAYIVQWPTWLDTPAIQMTPSQVYLKPMFFYSSVQMLERGTTGIWAPITPSLTRQVGSSSNFTNNGLVAVGSGGSWPVGTSLITQVARIFNNKEYDIEPTPGTGTIGSVGQAKKSVFDVPANTDIIRIYFGDNATNSGWNPQSATNFDNIGWARYLDVPAPFGSDEGGGLRSVLLTSQAQGLPLLVPTGSLSPYIPQLRLVKIPVAQPSAFPSPVVG